ncbi:MAG: hypothetical protein ABI458_00415 [Chloroflexota bacterium]
MVDRDPFELVEMSPGAQPPSGFGDRILVGLALVALVGGALIAVTNLVPDPDEVAQASIAPSEKPVRTPRPSPTPSPPRVATLLDPDIGLAPPEQPYGFDGWIRALVDLVIRSSPDAESTEIGVLEAGDVAYASQQDQPAEEPGWLLLQDSQGWVATRQGGEQLARRYEYPRYRGSGWIESLTAGPDGFLAMITSPGGPYTYGVPRPAISTDGATWRSADPPAFDGWWVGSVAHGPSGWLAAAAVSDGSAERILVWGSPDGLRWSRLGMLGGMDQEYVVRLLGSESGYLMETESQNRGSLSGTTLWASADGLTWNESTATISRQEGYGDRHIMAVAGGFYVWGNSSHGAFSVDGLTWSVVDEVPGSVNLRLADFGERVVAIDLDPATLVPRVWSGSVVRGRLEWHRLATSDDFFAGGVVTQVVSDGRRVFAFGWDRSTEQPLVWTGNGVQWLRAPLPESFGGHPLTAAAGPSGVVVLGYRHSLRGDNPIAWHRTAVGGWLAEPEPMLAAVPDPSTNECPPPPADFLEFSVIDSAAFISCYGDAPITFQAFSVGCEGCSGTMEGNPQPAWLLNPNTNQLYLAPNENNTGWQSNVILGPDLEREPAWNGITLQLTGHFDDPASPTCHIDLTADTVQYSAGPQALIDQCRSTFVVTDVKVLPGP